MTAALYVLFVLNCLFLILVVLLQAGKGDGLAVLGAGGTSTNSVLGSRGAASFLSKLTVGSAVLFMLLSIILAFLSSRSDSRITEPTQNASGAVSAGMTGDDDGEEPGDDSVETPANDGTGQGESEE